MIDLSLVIHDDESVTISWGDGTDEFHELLIRLDPSVKPGWGDNHWRIVHFVNGNEGEDIYGRFSARRWAVAEALDIAEKGGKS
jgi:hypothetical protein